MEWWGQELGGRGKGAWVSNGYSFSLERWKGARGGSSASLTKWMDWMPLNLKMIKMVNGILYIFYHSRNLFRVCVCVCVHACAQLCPTLRNPKDYSPPGSSVHRISQAKVLEWVAISFSRGSSWIRNQTQVIPALAGRFFTTAPPGKPLFLVAKLKYFKRNRGGNSLTDQWWGLCRLTAKGPRSIPGQGTKITQAKINK